MRVTRGHAGVVTAEQRGVVFPAGPDGRRSTPHVGRGTVADALRASDPGGAASAERETNWRTGYLLHFRRLVEAGVASPDAATTIARDGLASLRSRMTVADGDQELPLEEWASSSPDHRLDCV